MFDWEQNNGAEETNQIMHELLVELTEILLGETPNTRAHLSTKGGIRVTEQELLGRTRTGKLIQTFGSASPMDLTYHKIVAPAISGGAEE